MEGRGWTNMVTDVGEEELGRAGGGETYCGLVTEGREQGRGRAGVDRFAVAW